MCVVREMETAIIVTGPAGSGKSTWVQDYAKTKNRQLFVCPCRKDRTLRDGRQKLHLWGRRTEPAILWLEGADDLTPEAQAFLRRILETHAQQVQFILECRDSSKLQDPIRSRCTILRLSSPTWDDLEKSVNDVRGISLNEIRQYMLPHEYSYRTLHHCIDLQLHFPDIWKQIYAHRCRENEIAKIITVDDIPMCIENAFNPENLLKDRLYNTNTKHCYLADYGECIDRSGSLWAFLSYILSNE